MIVSNDHFAPTESIVLLRFTKMHGAGNDYIYVNGFHDALPSHPEELAPLLSDRHKGIGADGLILICPTDQADAEMRMFNADGSESEMCGNGLRCVAKLLSDEGVVEDTEQRILTGAGVLRVEVEKENGLVERVRIEMGVPRLKATEIPTLLPGDGNTGRVTNANLRVRDKDVPVTCVSMGNPHCVVYLDDLGIEPADGVVIDRVVHELGPLIENHELFPSRVNVEFVAIESSERVRQRTWERGSGETLACGTGAAAVCVAGVLTNRTNPKLQVELLGGNLELEWPDESAGVSLVGPAEKVFSGQIEISQPEA